MSNEISREASWAFASDKLGRWLLHVPSGVVGKVVRVYAPGEYEMATEDQQNRGVRISAPVAVLGFEDGNAFLADPKNFEILTWIDAETYEEAVSVFRGCCEQLAVAGARRAVKGKQETSPIGAILRAALQAQLRALSPR